MIDFIICLIGMSWQASIVILAVLLLRILFIKGHCSKRNLMRLWFLPFFFLIFPWKIKSPVGFWEYAPADYRMNYESQTSPPEEQVVIGGGDVSLSIGTEADISHDDAERENAGTAAGENVGVPAGEGSILQNNTSAMGRDYTVAHVEFKTVSRTLNIREKTLLMLGAIWSIGIAVLLVYTTVSYRRLKKKLLCSLCVRENIYYADDIDTPIVTGIFRPRIYLPSGMEEECLEFAVWHEQSHIKRKDPLTKLALFLITGLHWFNPFAWLAFHLFCKDMEMACDEETIQRIGLDKRNDYADALLTLSSGKRTAFFMPVAFGEGDTGGRIRHIVSIKRPVKLLSAVMILSGILVGLCFITKTDAAGMRAGQDEQGVENAEADRTDVILEEVEIPSAENRPASEEFAPEDFASKDPAPGDSEPEENTAPEQESSEPEDSEPEDAVPLWHREGYREAVIHLYIPEGKRENGTVTPGLVPEEVLEQKAQNALRELYDLTGTQIEECYYYAYDPGEFLVFGNTPEDLERDRCFLTRCYSDITGMFITSARRVWYSDVNMYVLPEGYAGMSEEEKAIWFVVHSGLWNGKQAETAIQPYEWNPNIWHVIMEDDTAYEIILDSEIESFGDITGPYPNSNIQH